MGNFLGPLNLGDDGPLSVDGVLAENQNLSTTMKADYRVSTGFENDPDDETARKAALSRGYEGDTGQQPISQTPGWDSDVASNIVDDNFKNSPVSKPDGPDQQGQLLRGYVLNGPDVTAKVEWEGAAFQKGPMYVPRVTVLHDPNTDPGKGR